MNRKIITKIHLYLSAFFAPFLLVMAITGTCYLFGNKGKLEKEIVSSIAVGDEKINKEIVEAHIKEIDPNYSFEYIKVKPGVFYTRPTTRDYFEIKKKGQAYIVYKVRPNLLASLIEVHKGHGPKLVKILEKIIGFVLMLILLSGVWLSLQLKRDRKITLVLMGSGFVVLAAMIIFL